MRRIIPILGVVFATLLGLLAPAPAGAIIGGVDAVSNPGVVSLYTTLPDRNRCTGTLLDDSTPADGTPWVLTANHCVWSLGYPPAQPSSARVGSIDNTTGYTPYGIAKDDTYYVRPDFDDMAWTNDIMVIKLATPVPASVQTPVKWNLPSVAPGSTGTAMGWGWVCNGPSGLDCSTWYKGLLQQMATRILPDSDCVGHMANPERKLCFEERNGGNIMAGPGDSGGPLFTKDAAGQFEVRGVIIGDGDDPRARDPLTTPEGDNGKGMATDVSAFRFWIADVMAGNVEAFDLDTMYPPGCCGTPAGRSAAPEGLPWGHPDFELAG
jgi:secreted trypsin-like serine protease